MARLRMIVTTGVMVLASAGTFGYRCQEPSVDDATLVDAQHDQRSPSNQFVASVLSVDEGGAPAWRVVVSDTHHRELFRSNTSFSRRHRTLILWEDRVDRLWVYSGDIGTRVYERVGASGAWAEKTDKGLTPPPAIRKVYEQLGI